MKGQLCSGIGVLCLILFHSRADGLPVNRNPSEWSFSVRATKTASIRHKRQLIPSQGSSTFFTDFAAFQSSSLSVSESSTQSVLPSISSYLSTVSVNASSENSDLRDSTSGANLETSSVAGNPELNTNSFESTTGNNNDEETSTVNNESSSVLSTHTEDITGARGLSSPPTDLARNPIIASDETITAAHLSETSSPGSDVTLTSLLNVTAELSSISETSSLSHTSEPEDYTSAINIKSTSDGGASTTQQTISPIQRAETMEASASTAVSSYSDAAMDSTDSIITSQVSEEETDEASSPQTSADPLITNSSTDTDSSTTSMRTEESTLTSTSAAPSSQSSNSGFITSTAANAARSSSKAEVTSVTKADSSTPYSLNSRNNAVSDANQVLDSTSPSSTGLPVIPPLILNPVDPIRTAVGSAFTFVIPEDTFYDYTDGSTRFLDVSVATPSGEGFRPPFWLQYDQDTQTLRGLPLLGDNVDTPAEFVITATNSLGSSTRLSFQILIDSSVVEDPSHEFSATFNIRYQNILISRLYLFDLVTRLVEYYNDPDSSALSITAISNDSYVILSWTNNTISKDRCQNETLQELYEMLYVDDRINPAFRRTMLPDYPVSEVEFRLLGVCEEDSPVTLPSSSDDSTVTILLGILIPLIIIALIIIILVCYCYFCHGRSKQSGRYLPSDEKHIYSNRKPIIFDDEMNVGRRETPPKGPVIVPSDFGPLTYRNPAFEGDEPSGSDSSSVSSFTEKRGPSPHVSYAPEDQTPPPAYQVPPQYYLSPISTSSA